MLEEIVDQTPNTQIAFFEYSDAAVLFEVRGLKTPPAIGLLVGNIVYGSEGFVAFANEDSKSVVAFDATGKQVKTFRGGGNHFSNFITAVQNRKQADLNCPILEGHLSSGMCHLANISYRIGDLRSFNAPFVGPGTQFDLAEAFGRYEQHLADSALNLKEMSYQIGPRLPFDARSENFGSNAKANALLTREYRPPFVLPETV